MQRYFNLESPAWRFIGKLVDMVLLTVVWAVLCLPVVTIGAATTALYYVSMKMAADVEGYIFQDFFHAFRANFKQATGVWLLMLGFGGALAGALWWYYQLNNPVGVVVLPVLLVVAGLYLLVSVYLFALLARCEVSVKQLINMAFVMSIKNFGWSLFMVVCSVCMLAIGIFVAAPILVISAGLVAYVHGKVLKIVFEPYHLNLE